MKLLTIALTAAFLFLARLPGVAQGSAKDLPKVTSWMEPIYPPLARQARIQGDVIVEVTTDGHEVARMRVVESGHPLLTPSAEQSVRTWHFAAHEPTTFSVVFRYRLWSEVEQGDPPRVSANLPTEVDIIAAAPPVTADYATKIELEIWKSRIRGISGALEQTMALQMHDSWFSGLVVTVQVEEVELSRIRDGEAHENRLGSSTALKFSIERKLPGGKTLNVSYKGVLKGDSITGTYEDSAGTAGEWTARRQEP